MTALAADKSRSYTMCPPHAKSTFPVVSAGTIYQGSAVGESASLGTARALVAGDTFIGFNLFDRVENPSSGTKLVEVQMQGVLKGVSVTGGSGNANIGEAVYMADDNTFTTTVGSNTKIGSIVRYDAATGLCDVYFISDYLIVT